MMKLMHDHDPRTDFLADVALLDGLDRRRLRAVSSLTTGIQVPAGSILCQEGHHGDEFFIIQSGSVTVSTGATLGGGDFFGELALLNDVPRTATVTATEDTELLVLSRREFDELRRVDPHIGETMTRVIQARHTAT